MHFGNRQNQKRSDFKPRRCILISVWALLKWSLYSSTSIEAHNGISAAFKQTKKNPEAKRAYVENVQEEMERLGQAGRALSGWWSSALTGRWLMRRWSRPLCTLACKLAVFGSSNHPLMTRLGAEYSSQLLVENRSTIQGCSSRLWGL